ncbi:hypothetical protein QAD02_003433 [Eretmocerus hayati]|uniref:Uncharacterized protein n=1 Tax=Eretmocerus hayati TaxID=131215 RepID=A0ACC2NLR3_9HYME|nr:hypothetical protein QAD02_003433 [Eretmocerus hayati]
MAKSEGKPRKNLFLDGKLDFPGPDVQLTLGFTVSFERFNSSSSFLCVPCELWTQDESDKKYLELVRKIGVLNDAAGRAVELGRDYLNVSNKDEERKQYLIQVVPENRNEFPDATRQTLVKKRRLE